MSKLKFFLFSLSFILFIPFLGLASDETLTITTYYPSPYGVYNEMRSKRMAIGDDYINNADYTWELTDGDGGQVDYLADLVVEGNVGIGTTSPATKLDVSGDVRLKTHTSAPPSESGVVGEVAYASDGYLYAHNGSTWVKQGGGGSTCVVTYNSTVGSCSCPTGWTLKLDLGSWGDCRWTGVNFFRPPGGGCESGANSVDIGEGCLCCSS